MLLAPTTTDPAHVMHALRGDGYAVLSAAGVCEFAGCDIHDLMALRPTWDRLATDQYLKDGGHYRRRRHSCFVVDRAVVTPAPHRAHWQPVEYNALHGGMQRWFEPMEEAVAQSPAWPRLLHALAN